MYLPRRGYDCAARGEMSLKEGGSENWLETSLRMGTRGLNADAAR